MRKAASRLEKMQKYAYAHNIDILSSYYDCPSKGYCWFTESCAVIMMNLHSIQSATEYLCVLTEEIGHIKTNTVLPTDAYFIPVCYEWLMLKNELRAITFAVKKLVSASRIRLAIAKGHISICDMAIFCDVTEEFMGKALAYYEGRQVGFLGGVMGGGGGKKYLCFFRESGFFEGGKNLKS